MQHRCARHIGLLRQQTGEITTPCPARAATGLINLVAEFARGPAPQAEVSCSRRTDTAANPCQLLVDPCRQNRWGVFQPAAGSGAVALLLLLRDSFFRCQAVCNLPPRATARTTLRTPGLVSSAVPGRRSRVTS